MARYMEDLQSPAAQVEELAVGQVQHPGRPRLGQAGPMEVIEGPVRRMEIDGLEAAVAADVVEVAVAVDHGQGQAGQRGHGRRHVDLAEAGVQQQGAAAAGQ